MLLIPLVKRSTTPPHSARRHLLLLPAIGVLLAVLAACGESPSNSGALVDSGDATGGSNHSNHQATGGAPNSLPPPPFEIDPDGSGGGAAGTPPATIVEQLPSGFAPAEGMANGSDASRVRGGYRLIGPLAEFEDDERTGCANILRVVMRDFRTFGHPDFGGSKSPSEAYGLVLGELGSDRKPVRSTVHPQVAVQFSDWYVNVPETNVPYLVDLWLEPDSGAFVFDSSRFFPLDSVTDEDDKHRDQDGVYRNFGFTTELHTAFQYQGGEEFTFRGDDDVFVFVDGQLVVDLGGVHNPIEGSVEIDDLGLTLGEVYTLDLFQAERNPTGSNFRLETTLDFTECGTVLPGDVIIR